MKKKGKFIYISFCVALLAISLLQIARYYLDYSKGTNSYEQAQIQFGISVSDVPTPQIHSPNQTSSTTDTDKGDTVPILKDATKIFKDCNFENLANINSDIIGWIAIPGTQISYPICQGTDNSYYLSHTFDHSENRVGAIFADYRIQEPFTGKNTVLYGHHMRDQSMFAGLMAYQDKDYREKNPYVYICTPTTVYVYEIYSAFQGDPLGLSYRLNFSSEKDTKEFINYTQSNAYYATSVAPDNDDTFLTLSTCTGNGHAKRMIVHCRLICSGQL